MTCGVGWLCPACLPFVSCPFLGPVILMDFVLVPHLAPSCLPVRVVLFFGVIFCLSPYLSLVCLPVFWALFALVSHLCFYFLPFISLLAGLAPLLSRLYLTWRPFVFNLSPTSILLLISFVSYLGWDARPRTLSLSSARLLVSLQFVLQLGLCLSLYTCLSCPQRGYCIYNYIYLKFVTRQEHSRRFLAGTATCSIGARLCCHMLSPCCAYVGTC